MDEYQHNCIEIIHARIGTHTQSTTVAREPQQNPKGVIVLKPQGIAGPPCETDL